MIFVGDRRPEDRHDSIAGELVDRPLETVHPVGEDLEEAVHDPIPLFWIDLLAELHRPLHVGEQHRHLLALALESAAGGEDLLGEVLRGVGARVGCGRRDAGGRNGTSLCARPHEDVALKDGDALDLYQLVAELGERLRIEIELSAEGTQGYAPMALEERACAVNCLEKAHLRLTIVGMRRTRLEVVRDRRPGRQIRARDRNRETSGDHKTTKGLGDDRARCAWLPTKVNPVDSDDAASRFRWRG